MIIKGLLVILSGLLTGLSFTSSYLSFLVWFSLVPFIYVIARSKIKESFLWGFIFGLIFYGVSIFWLGKVSKLGVILLVFYLSFYPALFSLLARLFFNKPWRIIILPCIWIILEYAKENLFTGFGWVNLGYSQYRNLYLIQIADLGGVKLISYLVVMVNVLIGEICLKEKFLLRKVFFVFFILLVSLFYSLFRLNNLEAKDTIKVAIVQPNISQILKWQESMGFLIVEKLEVLAKETEEDSLVIFPESSWPFVLDKDNYLKLKEFIRRIKRDVLIGVVEKEGDSFYNAAFLFKKGELREIYRKIKLVPFGEYVPLRNYLRFVKVINSIGDMSRGKNFKTFSYQDKNFSSLICFEDIFPLFVSRFSRRSDFLINITNDAWFGGEPQASQHLGIMTLRAIENRISIVRCANTGISGWVSFKGELENLKKDNKEVFFSAVGNFKITLNGSRSFYNRYPEMFVLLCNIFLGGIVLAGKYR